MKKSIWIFLALLILGIAFITFGSENPWIGTAEVNNIKINNPNETKKKLKVLLIEINPILTSVTNTELYGTDNNGHPYASEYIYYDSWSNTAHNKEKPINEMIEDIEEMSHGNIEIEMQREWLNEFPKWKVKVDLNNGTKDYKLDEETFISTTQVDGKDYGNWYNLIDSRFWNDDTAYQFDYDYFINKFNLVNRRNNKEFDQVWIYSIDPIQSFETVMVGRAGETYWVNGELDRSYNCDAFFMPTISMIRTDANLHAFGHGVEGIMQEVFNSTNTANMNDRYTENYYIINSLSAYNNLNLWDRFTLTSHNNNSNYSSVGIIHYPFNASNDYDYTNTTNVKSNWADWLNYPNFTNSFVTSNNNAWMNHPINTSLAPNEDKDPDRLYSRLWFYLLPHITGYYEDGHVNNWWSYIVSLDYVKNITANGSRQLSININEKVPVNYTLSYKSNSTETVTTVFEGANVHISDPSVVDYINGVLYGKKSGTTDVQIFYDGISITYTVNVASNSSVSTNNNLIDIKIDGISIDEFSSSKTAYTIGTDKSTVEITATKEDSSATITGTGTRTLEFGENIVNITVTSASGSSKIYVLTINRNDTRDGNTALRELLIEGLNIDFDKDVLSYNVNVDNATSNITIGADAESSTSTVEGTGTKAVTVGLNVFRITVTAENDETRTYEINVIRAAEDGSNPVVTLTYNSNGGSDCAQGTHSVNNGDAWGELCTTSRSGYSFNGWYTQKKGGTKVTSTTIANSDLTVYAQWRKVIPSNPKTGISTPIIAIIVLGIVSSATFIIVMNKNKVTNI